MPRVETGGHTAFVKKLSIDKAGQYLLTVSDDKTARLWSAMKGNLVHVFRVPIENGNEGQLYAAAISPDGAIAAVGGYAGFFEHGSSTVYFFDTTSGSVVLRLGDISNRAVENLAFSEDGKVLAVCFGDGGGMRIYDLGKHALILRVDKTPDKILGASFSRNGDLAMTTVDGQLWVFSVATKYGYTIVRLSGGHAPMHVQYSPDGTQLAVGFDGDPAFSIVDARTLKEIYTARLPKDAGQRGLHAVDWSEDGQYIYAGGDTVVHDDAPIYRFGQQGRGAPERVLTSTERVSDIRRLPGGAMAFSSGEPEVGVVEASGRVRWRLRSATLDLRQAAALFQLSPSASIADFGDGKKTAFHFDVLQSPDSALKVTSGQASALSSPPRDPTRWSVVRSEDKQQFSINGVGIELDNHESVYDWAQTPDGQRLIVGTAWSLRCFDHAGKSVWAKKKAELSAEVRLLRISADGHAIVAALSDGTIRWYRPEDGVEFLALFVNNNGRDWIAWIPSGYYMSSVSGDNFIGWHVNRAADQNPDFYRAVQFERILFRPDLVQSWFKSRGLLAPGQKLNAGDAFDIAQLSSIAPPRLQLLTSEVTGADGVPRVKVSVDGESPGLPLQDWSLFVNDIPFAASQPLSEAERLKFHRELTVPLAAGSNRIRVESSNGRAMGYAETAVENSRTTPVPPGDLYVVAVGASAFSDAGIHSLKYAANDATEVARVFEQLGHQGSFKATHSLILTDTAQHGATGANIRTSLGSFLASAHGEDTVVVFLASHGLSDPQGNYYFVPADARYADIEAVLAGADKADSLVRWDFFVDQLRHTAGRRLLIVDTCSSAALAGTFDVHSLAKRSMSSSFALVAASKASEESQELASAQHGLFTFGLLEALRTGYDPDGDGVVSLDEAFEYTFDKVQELRNKAVGQQTPNMNAPEVLRQMALAPAGSKRRDGRVIINRP